MSCIHRNTTSFVERGRESRESKKKTPHPFTPTMREGLRFDKDSDGDAWTHTHTHTSMYCTEQVFILFGPLSRVKTNRVTSPQKKERTNKQHRCIHSAALSPPCTWSRTCRGRFRSGRRWFRSTPRCTCCGWAGDRQAAGERARARQGTIMLFRRNYVNKKQYNIVPFRQKQKSQETKRGNINSSRFPRRAWGDKVKCAEGG